MSSYSIGANFLLKTLKVSATSEVGFFLILLAYALTGLTYNFKDMDKFMLSIWITYFLYSFRSDLEMKALNSPLWAAHDAIAYSVSGPFSCP